MKSWDHARTGEGAEDAILGQVSALGPPRLSGAPGVALLICVLSVSLKRQVTISPQIEHSQVA